MGILHISCLPDHESRQNLRLTNALETRLLRAFHEALRQLLNFSNPRDEVSCRESFKAGQKKLLTKELSSG